MLRPRRCRSCFRDRCSQLISACLPEIGCQGWTRTNTVRFNKPSCYFDTTWQWLIGAAGRTSTCIVPLRRRMPDVFDHGSFLKWSTRQDLHLRSLGPRPSALAATLRADGPDFCFVRAGETQDTNPGKVLR